MQADIRDATPHDLPAIVDLLNATLASTTYEYKFERWLDLVLMRKILT
jgi:L-amino acid N-acyltransferase YncA